MIIHIPSCGDAFILTQLWSFKLHPGHRNSDLFEAVGQPLPAYYKDLEKRRSIPVELPAGIELVFDRLYVRQGMADYDSVTFIIKDHPEDQFVGVRFWAKLNDVNNLNVEPTSTGNPVGGFAKATYKRNLAVKRDPSLLDKAAATKAKKAECDDARKFLCAEVGEASLTLQHHPEISAFLERLSNATKKTVTDMHCGRYHKSDFNHFRSVLSHDDKKNASWMCKSTRRNDDASVDRMFVPNGSVTSVIHDPLVKADPGGFIVTSIDGKPTSWRKA